MLRRPDLRAGRAVFPARHCSACCGARRAHEPCWRSATSPNSSAAWSPSTTFRCRSRRANCAPIIGPNGAGKTTFFNMITGFFPPTAGRDRVRRPGRSRRFRSRARVALGMARTFQITEIFPELTVHENVRIRGRSRRRLRLQPVAAAPSRRRGVAPASTRCCAGGLTAQGGPAGRRAGARRPARRRDRDGAGAAAAAAAARRADRRHGRAGNLPDRRADPPAAQGQQLTIVLIEHDMRVVFNLADRITVLDQGRAGRRHAAGNRRQSGGAGRLSGEGRMRRAGGRGPQHLLRQEPHPARGRPDRRRGPHHHAARPQRRRQDHDAAQPHGPDAAAHRACAIFGTETTRLPPFRIAALGVGYVPEGRRIFPNLTVEENLRVPLERPGPWTIRSASIELFPRLEERRRTAAASFPAASRRCCRSPARCCSIRGC